MFFAVFGYDALTTAAEEARNPARDLPRAVLLSLAIAMVLYVAMCLVLTGIVPYQHLDTPAPVASAFREIGLPGAELLVSVGAVAGITSVLFSCMLACARIWFALSRDGLLPGWFSVTHARFGTPHRPTLSLGVLTAVAAGVFPIRSIAELVNIGSLSAFVVICVAVVVLRRRSPGVARSFRVPALPVVAGSGGDGVGGADLGAAVGDGFAVCGLAGGGNSDLRDVRAVAERVGGGMKVGALPQTPAKGRALGTPGSKVAPPGSRPG